MRDRTLERSLAVSTRVIILTCALSLVLAGAVLPWLGASAPGGAGKPPPPYSAQDEYVTEFDAAAYPFSSIVFKKSWYPEYYAQAHGGQLYVSSGNKPNGSNDGASVQVTFYGTYVKLVSARFWQCGWCEVFLDGSSRGSFNLYYDNPDSGEPDWEYVLFEEDSLAPGYHTIKVVNAGVPGSDDPIAQEYDLHFVNVDYLVVR